MTAGLGLVFLGSGSEVLIWDALPADDASDNASSNASMPLSPTKSPSASELDVMTDHLRSFVAIPSVSGNAQYTEGCYEVSGKEGKMTENHR